ncbi:hypothetical protein [Hydrogenophaga sp. PAMC20947]|uniref:hypothetical protein n=1 Tax=Hydrogenophaga sp. PAMC20947 TaxID=2565558 RepID=UPI00109D9502|nr:hypothetical protein [Hydrogenophaga sp. PAMC20947]QCB48023.1 hypothetical protein E5678_19555 [Hydrogenophaga sp. PAMC20947]
MIEEAFSPAPDRYVTAAQEDPCVVPALVGELFEVALPAERGRLLEYLLPHMGVLALVSIANGVFANIRFNSPLRGGHVQLDEALSVQGGDVAALVDRLQMVSVEAVDGLAQFVSASPAMAGTAAAAMLLAVLSRRAKLRQKPVQASFGVSPSAR